MKNKIKFKKIEDKEEVINIINNIKDLWYEPYEDIKNQEYGISFGSYNENLVMFFITSLKSNIDYILKEIK